MSIISINSIQLNYETSGSGPALVLIGGLTANCREWLRLEPYLAPHFTLYKPENRGAGNTIGWNTDITIEQMADDITSFLEVKNISSAYIVGHSMGGAILQQLCIRHPKKIKAAIIASSFPYFPKAAQLYIENTAELLNAGVNMELVLKTIYTRLYGSAFLSHSDNVTSEMSRMLTDPSPQSAEGYWAQVKAIEKFNSLKDLKKITCPTMIIHGVDDILTPSILSEELHINIKNSQLRYIPKCGHMIPQECPMEFSQLIIDFFKPEPN